MKDSCTRQPHPSHGSGWLVFTDPTGRKPVKATRNPATARLAPRCRALGSHRLRPSQRSQGIQCQEGGGTGRLVLIRFDINPLRKRLALFHLRFCCNLAQLNSTTSAPQRKPSYSTWSGTNQGHALRKADGTFSGSPRSKTASCVMNKTAGKTV